jgi:hypothetical protein
VEKYIVVCEDFHGAAGPFTKAEAEALAREATNGGGLCVYRAVVFMEAVGVPSETKKKDTRLN